MSKQKITPVGYPNIQVTKGMVGWFAVKIWWNPDPGFPEPYESGPNRYQLQDGAIAEAQEWAKREGIPFKMPIIDTNPARTDWVEQLKEIVPGITVIELED